MDLKTLFFIAAFVVLGIPFVGYAWTNMVRFGRYIYRSFPFLQKFFDDYFEHYILGVAVTVICGIVWAVLHFGFGLV